MQGHPRSRTGRPAMPAQADGELARAARAGDTTALGALLERHRAVMLAEALRLTREPAAAQDAVQEACLIAVRRIDALRDPDAARAWLLAVVRRACLMAWRAAPGGLGGLPGEDPVADRRERPDVQLERAASDDWLWTAIGRLSEPLRTTVLLRYFSDWSSYATIADVLGVPVGTVRSRLHVARERLAAELELVVDAAHADVSAARGRQEHEFRAAADELNRGSCRALVGAFADDARATFTDGTTAYGRAAIRTSLESDLAAGTQMHVARVLVSGSITVVEAELVSAPGSAGRCPPTTCQVHARPHGRTAEVRLHFTPRESVNAPAPAAG